MENPLGTGSQRDWQAIGVASGLGCTVVVSLLLCIGGGIVLDRWLETSPIFTLIGMGLGLVTAAYSLYELAVLSDTSKGVVKLHRRTANRAANGEEGSQPGRD